MVHILGDYRLIVVLSGIIASIVCGAIKTPIAAYIKAKNLSEKSTSQRLTVVCTIITAVVGVVMVVFFRCYEAHSLAPFGTVDLYFEIVASVAFSRIFYSMYEGAGPVSLKKWAHVLIEKMFHSKPEAEVVETAVSATVDVAEQIQDFLSNELGLPLTDEQKERLEKRLK